MLALTETDWTQVWENPPIDLMDSQWVPVVLDISSVAANQATVFIQIYDGADQWLKKVLWLEH